MSLMLSNNQVTNADVVLTPKYLNPDAERELELSLDVQLTKFDQTTKKADFYLNWSIHDQKTKKPFEAMVRIVPYGGGNVINVDNGTSGFYRADQELFFHDHPVFPRYSALNLWPHEEYVIPVFLQFNDTVKLKQWPTDKFKTGSMTNDVNWNLDVLDGESSLDAMKHMMPSPYYEDEKIGSVFKYEIIVSTSPILETKNFVYAMISLIPIALIVAHIKYVKGKKLSTQVQLFTGIVVLLITGLFTNRQTLPSEITLFEIILAGSIGGYTVWFFKLLRNRKNDENQSCEHKIYR